MVLSYKFLEIIPGFLISKKISTGEFIAKKNSLTKIPFMISKILPIDGLLTIFQTGKYIKKITGSTFSFSVLLGLFLIF